MHTGDRYTCPNVLKVDAIAADTRDAFFLKKGTSMSSALHVLIEQRSKV
jgi:hypothetical protein